MGDIKQVDKMSKDKVISYNDSQINDVLFLLNTISIKGESQIKSMVTIFEILKHPVIE